MEFQPQDEVVVSMPQLHNKTSLLEKGEVLSVQSNSASVLLEGEDVPRTVPMDRLKLADEVFGNMTGRPNEMPIINQMR